MLPTISLSSKVSWNRKHLTANVGEEFVLMNVDQDKYFNLDAVGSDIWRRIEAPIVVDDLCAALKTDYDGVPEKITCDLVALLQQMAEGDLITVEG